MNPQDLVAFDGQIVELHFNDGEQIRAHIVSVDPDVADNHVFYVLLGVIQPGPPRSRQVPLDSGCGVSAQEIARVVPTDGQRRALAPASARPWWKFW